MIRMDSDFRTKTCMGLTSCAHSESILSDYRDVVNVDRAVTYVKKLFSKSNFDPCVTFSDNRTLGRIFEDWKDGKKGYTFIFFNEHSTHQYWRETLKMVDVKVFYLNIADNAMEMEKTA